MFEGLRLRERSLSARGQACVAAGVFMLAGCGGHAQAKKELHSEIEQFGANTFTDFNNASGIGPYLKIGAKVVVDCIATGPVDAAPSVHGKWYHIEGPKPYSNLYVAANTFENGNPNDMSLAVDPNVPVCSTP